MDVLAERYASPEMANLWDGEQGVAIERGIWITVMKQQGVDPQVIADYRKVLLDVNLESIAKREQTTGHDLKARLEEFNALAGHQAAHRGLTSADVTENATRFLTLCSIDILFLRLAAVTSRLSGMVGAHRNRPMVARTHNLPAQVTTLGLRFAHCCQDLSVALNTLQHLRMWTPLRGLKGAVGTGADLLRTIPQEDSPLLGLVDLETRLARLVNASSVLAVSRQTGARGSEAMIAAAVVALCAGPANCATTLRLMAGQGLSGETPLPGSTGSTAMPHKANPRYAERVCGLMTVVRGYATMLTERVGDTWNEGDISDSCIRRIALPGLFLAADGLLRSFMVALDRFEPDLEAIDAELECHRFEMQASRLQDELVQRGVGREDAHAMVRDHWRAGRNGSLHPHLDGYEVETIIGQPWDLGLAPEMCDLQLDWARSLLSGVPPEAADYDPGAML